MTAAESIFGKINLIKMCNNMQGNISKVYYIAKVSTSYKLL